MNPFFIFRSQMVREAKQNFSTQKKISVQAAEIWNNMSCMERLPFFREAVLRQEEHKKKYPDCKFQTKKLKTAKAESMSKGKALTSRRRVHLISQDPGKSSVSGIRQSGRMKEPCKAQKASSIASVHVAPVDVAPEDVVPVNSSVKPNQVMHAVVSSPDLTDHNTHGEAAYQTGVNNLYSGNDKDPILSEERFTESNIADLLDPFDRCQLPWLSVLEGHSQID